MKSPSLDRRVSEGYDERSDLERKQINCFTSLEVRSFGEAHKALLVTARSIAYDGLQTRESTRESCDVFLMPTNYQFKSFLASG